MSWDSYLAEHFGDSFNDDAVTFCGECHHPMQVVRPGRTNCTNCEAHRVVTELIKERNALRVRLAAFSPEAA